MTESWFPEVERFLRARLAEPLPGPLAQQRFAPSPRRPDWMPDQSPPTARHAAALVVLYPNQSDVIVPLTVRHHDLPHHPGQVSLPGGAIDDGESVEAAALREAHEEIGLSTERVRLLGTLSTLWVPVSNFVIHPVVGVADAPPEFRLHPHEVVELVEVRLSDLRDPARLRWTHRERAGLDVEYPYFDVAGHTVWGATAMILGEFVCLFDPEHTPRTRP